MTNNGKHENVLDTLLDELQTFTNPNSIDLNKKDLNRSSSTESKTGRKTIEQSSSRKKSGKMKQFLTILICFFN